MYRYQAVLECNVKGATSTVIPSIQPLLQKLFLNGRDYFSKNFRKEDRDNVVQVHADFVMAHDKKKDQLKVFRLCWLLDG
jgi:hypothetical protein